MRKHLAFVDRRQGFIKRAGYGIIPLTKSSHLEQQFSKLNLIGQGTVAHKHVEDGELEGTVIHPHKHSTKETQKQRSIQKQKFNF